MDKFSIILFDRREKTYAIIGMNYLESEKEQEVKRLKTDGLPAFPLTQGNRSFTEKDVDAEVTRITNGQVSKSYL